MVCTWQYTTLDTTYLRVFDRCSITMVRLSRFQAWEETICHHYFGLISSFIYPSLCPYLILNPTEEFWHFVMPCIFHEVCFMFSFIFHPLYIPRLMYLYKIMSLYKTSSLSCKYLFYKNDVCMIYQFNMTSFYIVWLQAAYLFSVTRPTTHVKYYVFTSPSPYILFLLNVKINLVCYSTP